MPGTLTPISLKKDYAIKQFLDANRWDSDQSAVEGAINKLISSVADGDSGADNIKMTPLALTGGASDVQSIIEALVAVLATAAGASNVGATVAGLTGTDVLALLDALKDYIDTHKTSDDHDGRYYDTGEIDTFVNALAQALATHQASNDHDSKYFTETELGSTADNNAGANRIGATPIPGLAGSNVQAILEAMKLAIDAVVMGVIPDASIDNGKLGTDIKVGSLASLTTEDKDSVTDAINELVTAIADKASASAVQAIADLIVDVATPNSLLLTDENSKLAVNITGDANTLQSKSPGNANGNIAVSNGTLCTNLNAEMVGGKRSSDLAQKSDIAELDYNVYGLLLQAYYDSKIVPKQGLLMEGFTSLANMGLPYLGQSTNTPNAYGYTGAWAVTNVFEAGMLVILEWSGGAQQHLNIVTVANGVSFLAPFPAGGTINAYRLPGGILSAGVSAGVSAVAVKSAMGLAGIVAGQTVQISAPDKTEEKVVQSIVGTTINFTTPLANSYPANAFVTRMNVKIETSNKQIKSTPSRILYGQNSWSLNKTYGYNTTVGNNRKAQRLDLPQGSTIEKIMIGTYKQGAPTDNLYLTLHDSVNGAVVATSENVLGSTLGIDSNSRATFTFSNPYKTATGTVYVRLQRSGAVDTTNYYTVGIGNRNTDLLPDYYDVSGADAWTVGSAGNALVIVVWGWDDNPLHQEFRDDKYSFPNDVTNARLWLTRNALSAGMSVTPEISVVASGASESFQSMTLDRTVDNGDGTFEETYSWSGAGGKDVVAKLDIDRATVAQSVQIKKYGCAVGV